MPRRSIEMIKGRVAEAIIEELFIELDFNVFRYGMENTIPSIMQLLKTSKDDVSKHIRKMPDLVINKGKHNFFIEVKFRKNGEWSFDNIEKDYPFDNVYFVLVSKKHIQCLNYKDIQNIFCKTLKSLSLQRNIKKVSLSFWVMSKNFIKKYSSPADGKSC